MKCSLPGGLLGRATLSGISFSVTLGGFFAFADCGNVSPRAPKTACPIDESIVFDMGMKFWGDVAVGVGRLVLAYYDLLFVLASYGGCLSMGPGKGVVPGATRRCSAVLRC